MEQGSGRPRVGLGGRRVALPHVVDEMPEVLVIVIVGRLPHRKDDFLDVRQRTGSA